LVVAWFPPVDGRDDDVRHLQHDPLSRSLGAPLNNRRSAILLLICTGTRREHDYRDDFSIIPAAKS